MNRTLRFTGLLLASLTISTVAISQQNGGGHGGDDGGQGGQGGKGAAGGGAPSVFQLLREVPAGKARLTRAVGLRGGGANRIEHVCSEPPPTRRLPTRAVAFQQTHLG